MIKKRLALASQRKLKLQETIQNIHTVIREEQKVPPAPLALTAHPPTTPSSSPSSLLPLLLTHSPPPQ
jgi:hypothetical protein